MMIIDKFEVIFTMIMAELYTKIYSFYDAKLKFEQFTESVENSPIYAIIFYIVVVGGIFIAAVIFVFFLIMLLRRR